MNLHIQTSIFGKLVRLLSHNKYFKYPDEIDPSLWKEAIQNQAAGETAEIGQSSEDSTKHGQSGSHSVHNDQALNGVSTGNVLLVAWYIPDDPEVCAELSYPIVHEMYFLNHCVDANPEPSKLAQRPEAYDRFSNVRAQLCRLHRELDICSRRARSHEGVWC